MALDEFITKSQRSVKRLAEANRLAENEIEAEALDREQKTAARQWKELQDEREELLTELSAAELTPGHEKSIRM